MRDEHGDVQIRRVILEQDLKREYQEFLQDHNRDRSDSDGRPDRSEDEIRDWAREHDLPYFDGQVHFPDYRIEYEVDGGERHEDVELFTPHYRGAHAASRSKTGFRKVNATYKDHLHASPRELFAAERPHLRPLPLFVPEVYALHHRLVDVEGYVNVHGHRYSVPHRRNVLSASDGQGPAVAWVRLN